MPNSYSFNSYGDIQVLFSVTNNLDDVKRDSVKPFSFIEFIDNSRQTEKNNNTIDLYKVYLQSWNQINNKSSTESSSIVKEQFINLFKEITLNYTSPEEKRYLQNLDFSDEENISIAVPFFSSKIKKIILYYQDRRKTHTKDLKEIRSKGNKNNVSNYVKSKLIDFVENNESEEVETLTHKLTSIQKFVEVDIEDSYDIYNDYFDIDPSKPPDFYAGSDTFTVPNITFLNEVPVTTTTTTTTPEPIPVVDPLPPVIEYHPFSNINDIIVIPSSNTVLPPVITEATEVNIFFDSSGSMDSTLAPLQEMQATILDSALMPFYNNDRDLYNEKVNVISDPSERTFDYLSTPNTNEAADVLNIVFQDESSPYGADNNSYEPPTSQYLSDIATARSNLLNRVNNRYLIFQVVTNATGYSPIFAAFLAAVENGTGSYSGSSGLSESEYSDKIKFAYNINPGSTPIYYANLIIDEMQLFEFDVPDLPHFIVSSNEIEVNVSNGAGGVNLETVNQIGLNESEDPFAPFENSNEIGVTSSNLSLVSEIENYNEIGVNDSNSNSAHNITNANSVNAIQMSYDFGNDITNSNNVDAINSNDITNDIINSNSINVNQSNAFGHNITNSNSIVLTTPSDQVYNIANSNNISVNQAA